jgi:hypothetical protein
LQIERRAGAGGGLDLAIDSTGLRLAKPVGAGHEGWRKLHVAVNPNTGQILAEELTRSDVHDTVPVPALLDRITRPDRACLRRRGRRGRTHLPGGGRASPSPTERGRCVPTEGT